MVPVTTSNPSKSSRIMVALPRELRARVSEIAREASLSESRIAAELIAKGLGHKSVLALPEHEVSR